MLREHETRLVPIEACEISYARNRRLDERPPHPQVGQRVWYRHHEWDPPEAVTEATVLWVQSLDDQSPDAIESGNLWHLVRDVNGRPILDAGVPRLVRVADPWPQVLLDTAHGRFYTWEARVRGSAGWLPEGWQARPARLPADILAVERPALAPLNA